MILLQKLLCAALLCGSQDPVEPGPAAPFEDLAFEAACARAAEAGRIVLVSVVGPDCDDCRRLAEHTWSDDGAARWIEVEAVAIEVEAGERADLVERYAVGALPTVLLLEPDGVELDRFEGFSRPARFINLFKGALELREVLQDLRPRLDENPEDPELYLALARAYASVDRLEPAVEAFDTAWRVGRGVPLFERVRTGQMLNELGRLTLQYPPAKKTLVRWRRDALNVLADPSSPDAVRAAEEVSAINRFTHDALDTLELYERMRATPGVPRAVLDALFDNQVFGLYYGQGRFAELAEGVGDVFVRTDELFANLELWRTKEREGTVPPGEEPMVSILANSLYARTGMFLDMLLQLDRGDEARQLVDLVLLREPTSAAYSALMRAARKGGAPGLAREIADRGLAALGKRELAQFQEVVDGFFRERGH